MKIYLLFLVLVITEQTKIKKEFFLQEDSKFDNSLYPEDKVETLKNIIRELVIINNKGK